MAADDLITVKVLVAFEHQVPKDPAVRLDHYGTEDAAACARFDFNESPEVFLMDDPSEIVSIEVPT